MQEIIITSPSRPRNNDFPSQCYTNVIGIPYKIFAASRWIIAIVLLALYVSQFISQECVFIPSPYATGGCYYGPWFLSDWTFIVVIIYFFIASKIASDVVRRDGHEEDRVELLKQSNEDGYKSFPMAYLTQRLFFNVGLTTSMFVAVVYWVQIYPTQEAQGRQLDVHVLLTHLIGMLALLLELFTTNIPVRLEQTTQPTMFCACYLIFYFFVTAISGRTISLYPDLFDWEPKTISYATIALTVGLLFVLVNACHGFAYVLYKIKLRVLKQCKGMMGGGMPQTDV